MFQFKSATPAHVKAAMAFNQLLSHYNCEMKYEPMKNGDKVKWVYLKQNPLGLDGVSFKGYDELEKEDDTEAAEEETSSRRSRRSSRRSRR